MHRTGSFFTLKVWRFRLLIVTLHRNEKWKSFILKNSYVSAAIIGGWIPVDI